MNKIDITRFPLKAEECSMAGTADDLEEFGRMLNHGDRIVVMRIGQVQILLDALHKSVPEEKELPDSEGWWFQWHICDRWVCTQIVKLDSVLKCWIDRVEESWTPVKGRWIKIQEPEPIK